MKVGDKITLHNIEWEIKEVKENTVVLKTDWQGTGVTDDEALVVFYEVSIEEMNDNE